MAGILAIPEHPFAPLFADGNGVEIPTRCKTLNSDPGTLILCNDTQPRTSLQFPEARSRCSPGGSSSNPSKSPGRNSRLIRWSSSSHCPRSSKRQRFEQNGPEGNANQAPRRWHWGHGTSGKGLLGFIDSTNGEEQSGPDSRPDRSRLGSGTKNRGARSRCRPATRPGWVATATRGRPTPSRPLQQSSVVCPSPVPQEENLPHPPHPVQSGSPQTPPSKAGSGRSKLWKRSTHPPRAQRKCPSLLELPCERRPDPAPPPIPPPKRDRVGASSGSDQPHPSRTARMPILARASLRA